MHDLNNDVDMSVAIELMLEDDGDVFLPRELWMYGSKERGLIKMVEVYFHITLKIKKEETRCESRFRWSKQY